MLRGQPRMSIRVLTGMAMMLGSLSAHAGAPPRGSVDAAIAGVHTAADATKRYFDRVFGDRPPMIVPRGLYVFDPAEPGGGEGGWTHIEGDDRTPERIVLLVHGLDEPGNVWDDAAPALARAGHSVVRFEYANDQAICRSAEDLDAALRGLHARGTRRVAIVAHSMGGLVARDVLTNPLMYAGVSAETADLPAVDRLIMVGTPNLGSPLAKFRAVTELRERVVRWWSSRDHNVRDLGRFGLDGQGAAGDDLLPGSDYLNELNARSLPRGEVADETALPVTVVVGRLARPADVGLDRRLLDTRPVREWLGVDRYERIVGAVDEFMTSVGDGVVSERSARLDGIDDVVVLPASHRGMVRRLLDSSAPPPAIPVIIERLSGE